MHKGDIILNKWASEDNPARVCIITHIGAAYTNAYYEHNGNLRTCRFYTRELKHDKEHFIVIDNMKYEKPIMNRLKTLREQYKNG